MKPWKLGAISVALAATLNPVAQADLFTVQELPVPSKTRDLAPTAINDQGMIAALARMPLDVTIDLSRVTPSALASAGIPSDIDVQTYQLSYAEYTRLVNYLQDRNNMSLLNQRVGYNFAALFDGQTQTLLSPLDGQADLSPTASTTVDSNLLALNQHNSAVGYTTAPYTELSHSYLASDAADAPTITELYQQRDFSRRALWLNGNNFRTYEPPFTEQLGGESVMFDINDHNVAVGAVSVGFSPNGQQIVDSCIEDAAIATTTRPLFACIWSQWFVRQGGSAPNLQVSFFQSLTVPTNQSIYDMAASKWQLDANGNVIASQQWGTLLERTGEDDLEDFSSYAYAINNNDIAVGQSWTYYNNGLDNWQGNPQSRIKMPALFVDETVLPMTESTDYLWGSARDINDDNIAIGFVLKEVQGFLRYVGFHYNVDTDTFAELPSFFIGSSLVANAINNQGLIVGSAEIESSLNVTRRRVGFLYDLNNPTAGLTNLNDGIACDSGYFIVSADAINEAGEVLVTALFDREYQDEAGVTQTETTTRTLKLNPIANGSKNNCDVAEQVIEREGAATGWFGAFAMLLIGGLITIRRRLSI